MFRHEKQVWSHMSDLPTILSSGTKAGWRGIAFHEFEVSPEGRFDKESAFIALSMTCGPMKVRTGSERSAFLDYPTDPLLTLPGQHKKGSWKGAQRGLHLLIEPETIESFTGHAYHESAFRRLDGGHPLIEHLLRALLIDVHAGHPSGATLGETIVSAIICYISTKEAVGSITKGHQSPGLSQVYRLRDWIEANLGRPIALNELASEAGMSVRHLCRTFQRTTGYSPHRYILVRRVERAKQLISAGQLSLHEISAQVGFSHQAHMADTFKKIVGFSPSYFCNSRRYVDGH